MKADAAEGRFGFRRQELIEIDAEGGEGVEGVGHEAFAAGFVDGGLHGVDDFDVKTVAGGGDGSRRGRLGLLRRSRTSRARLAQACRPWRSYS